MNRLCPSSPKAQLEMAVPASIRPSSTPAGEKIINPPGPEAKRLPRASTFIPSGRPGRSGPTEAVMSAKTRRLATLPCASSA